MTRESVIQHIPGTFFVAIRQDYVELCKVLETDNNPCPDYFCASAIMNFFEGQTNSMVNSAEQGEYRNKILIQHGEEPTQDTSLWIYVSQEKLKDEKLLDIWGMNKVANCLTWLETVDVVETRINPSYPWNRTKQYLFNFDFINEMFTELNIPVVNSKDSTSFNSKDSSLDKDKEDNYASDDAHKSMKSPRKTPASDNAFELSKVIPKLLNLHFGREWNIAHMLSGTSTKKGYKEYTSYFEGENMVTPDELVKVVQYYRKQYPDAPIMQSPEIVADFVGKYRAYQAKRNEVPMFTHQQIWDFSDIDEQMGGGE